MKQSYVKFSIFIIFIVESIIFKVIWKTRVYKHSLADAIPLRGEVQLMNHKLKIQVN